MVKIGIDIPKAMLEFAHTVGAKEHPYDLCLECPFMNKTCDGPNVLAMEGNRWIDWANRRAKQLGLTRAQISELSGVPFSTVRNVMSGTTQDMRHSTMRDITKILVGGCWGQYPCHFASLLLEDASLEEDTQSDAALKEKIDDDQKKIDFLKNQIAFKEAQMLSKDNLIADAHRSRNLFRTLFIIMALFVCVLFGVDVMIGTVGWFRW